MSAERDVRSGGQAVLEAIAGWIGSWVAFPEVPGNQALILALWVLHTWFVGRWPVTAYMHITSDGPGCGKTTLMEVLAALSNNSRVRATLRALSVVRDIEAAGDAGVTYFFDQVEALTHARVSDEQAILLTGYRRGGEHGISVGQKQVAFSTYCAKAFASIGGIARDIRSRSLIVRLGFGVPARDWSDAVMVRGAEAERLLDAAADWFGSSRADFGRKGRLPEWISPKGFSGREKEIFTPLWSVAMALRLDGAMQAQILTAMEDFAAFKATVADKAYRDVLGNVGEAGKTENQEYSERALRDLAAVLPEASKTATGDIYSAVAVERMREGAGPWRVYKGEGLTVDLLAALLARFAVSPEEVRMQRGRSGKVLKGYKGRKVLLALGTLTEKAVQA